jgi:hypothetical protein
MVLEMVKFSSTNDILGFSLSGRRSLSDYDSTYVLNDNIQLLPRDQVALLESARHSQTFKDVAKSDQNLTQGFGGKNIYYRFDAKERMVWFQR